jgi:hypothetical protein
MIGDDCDFWIEIPPITCEPFSENSHVFWRVSGLKLRSAWRLTRMKEEFYASPSCLFFVVQITTDRSLLCR